MCFGVLPAVTMKIAVFEDVTPCSMVEEYHHFTGACCPHYHTEVQFDFARIMASHPRRCLRNRTLCATNRGFLYL
jgi:hypothetical protein